MRIIPAVGGSLIWGNSCQTQSHASAQDWLGMREQAYMRKTFDCIGVSYESYKDRLEFQRVKFFVQVITYSCE